MSASGEFLYQAVGECECGDPAHSIRVPFGGTYQLDVAQQLRDGLLGSGRYWRAWIERQSQVWTFLVEELCVPVPDSRQEDPE